MLHNSGRQLFLLFIATTFYRFYTNGGQTAAGRHVLCGSSSYIAISQIDSELSLSYLMFVSFIKVFTRIRMVSCQGINAI